MTWTPVCYFCLVAGRKPVWAITLMNGTAACKECALREYPWPKTT